MSKNPSAKLARVVFDGNVRTQSAPFYEVQHKGTMIEYTDKRSEAYDAWKQEPKVSKCFKIELVGGRAVRTQIALS